MADDTSAADFTEAESNRLDKVEQRLDGQDSKLDQIMASLAKLVPGSHAEAQTRTEQRLDRPSSVAEQVQAELARRDREAAEERARGEAKAESESVSQRLARLEEKPPAPPERRATKLMWGPSR